VEKKPKTEGHSEIHKLYNIYKVLNAPEVRGHCDRRHGEQQTGTQTASFMFFSVKIAFQAGNRESNILLPVLHITD